MSEYITAEVILAVEFHVPTMMKIDRTDLVEFLNIGTLSRSEQDLLINEDSISAYLEDDDSAEWKREFPNVDPRVHECSDSSLYSVTVEEVETNGSDSPR